MYRIILVFALLLLVSSAKAEAKTKLLEAPCIWLFKQKKWRQAATCFVSRAKLLPADKKYYRGRLLRNAALLWRKEALSSSADPAKARFAFQQSILYFERYHQNKLCLDAILCKQAAMQANKLCQRVGCGTLKISAKPAFASIGVKTGSWSLTSRGTWQEKRLPPGRYWVMVKAPGLATKRMRMVLSPKKKHHLRVSLLAPVAKRTPAPQAVPKVRVAMRRSIPRRSLPQPAPKSSGTSVLGWVGVVGGVALLAGGGALLGIGHASFASFKQDWDNPSKPAPNAAQQADARGQSDAMAASGIALLGVGGALAVVGIVAFVLNKPTKPTPTARIPLPKGSHKASISYWQREL